MVAVTLDLSEEELHFQFGANNWSSYVDQVFALAPPSSPFPATGKAHLIVLHLSQTVIV